VLESDIQKCREISGTIIFISLIMGMIICLVIVLIAYPLDYVFHVNVARIMTQLAPLIMVMTFSQSLPLILQSTNQIYLLAFFVGAPSILYLASILVLSGINQISTSSVLLSQQLTFLIVIIFVLVSIKPSFTSILFWWGEIKKHHKTYGFPVYRGSIANIGSGYLNRLAISYWVNNTAIGFYSLASSLVEPLKLLPNAIATSSFRSFATQSRISKKILLATAIISLASLVLAMVFFGQPLSWIYTSKFSEVGPMARALALGAIFVGFGDLFNRFLGAHGKGKALQNAAYIMGIANVAGIVIFVPLFGALGAVMTTIIAGVIYFLLMFLSYRAFSQKN
jgi:O-antigen/teichoic acid export membrane protein